ncbi:MAG: hypothetical protein F2813_00030 [Actinobacteria bacterium]|uniref:Unannotated protein n=1 Tax=freshwater metagenome TaxID=449393 RepID=A0A6J5YXB8_9ZZZZ|nr:hypothetical protein [Actinomycetota bacterium]
MAKETEERERVVLGLKGGGGLPLKLSTADRTRLFDSLEKGDWIDLDDEDGPVRVNCSQVVYVRSESEEHRVGFGLG